MIGADGSYTLADQSAADDLDAGDQSQMSLLILLPMRTAQQQLHYHYQVNGINDTVAQASVSLSKMAL